MTAAARKCDFHATDVRAAARSRLRQWLKVVETKICIRRLIDFDFRLATILTNYPSANDGRCWPGQKRLAEQAGRCERTIRDSLKRLQDCGLLQKRRGGQGRTSSYTFAIENAPLFVEGAVTDRQRPAVPDRQAVAGQDRQKVADKPIELEPKELPPLSPVTEPNGKIIRLRERGFFEEVWTATKRVASDSELGKGAAWAAWDKLSAADQNAILALARRSGGLDPGGVWLCKWFERRAWEFPEPQPETPERSVFELYADKVFVEEDTPEWDERVRDCLQFGGTNGLRVSPRAYKIAGKLGRFFPRERPRVSGGSQ